MNRYDVLYDGEVMLDNVDEQRVREYFADVRKEHESDKAAGYIEEDYSFEDDAESYQVMLYVDTELFL